jgi:hypothetical protein
MDRCPDFDIIVETHLDSALQRRVTRKRDGTARTVPKQIGEF